MKKHIPLTANNRNYEKTLDFLYEIVYNTKVKLLNVNTDPVQGRVVNHVRRGTEQH